MLFNPDSFKDSVLSKDALNPPDIFGDFLRCKLEQHDSPASTFSFRGSNIPPSAWDFGSKWATEGLGRLLLHPTALSLLCLIVLAPASAALQVPYDALITGLIGASGFASLGTSMYSLQLEKNPTNPLATSFTKIWLRYAGSASLAIFGVGYALRFLRRYSQQKRRAFLVGFLVCSLVCWVLVRPSMENDSDAFRWLDIVNLFGLFAVVAGILNAESSLLSSLCSQGGAGDGDHDEWVGTGGNGPRGDGESTGNDRRGADEENQVNVRPRGNHLGPNAGINDIGMVVLERGLSLAGAVLG
jgi:hypothetical protein